MAHLVNQRMDKKQSMRWSAEGAHQRLQVRCAVLDGQLANFFREWFPGFRENAGSFAHAMRQTPPGSFRVPTSAQPRIESEICETDQTEAPYKEGGQLP